MDYELAKGRILDFLKDFSVEVEPSEQDKIGDEEMHVYQKQLESIKNREQVPLYVMLDDVHTFDPELCEWIEDNTFRFRTLFYDVIDKYLTELRGDEQVDCINSRPLPSNNVLPF